MNGSEVDLTKLVEELKGYGWTDQQIHAALVGWFTVDTRLLQADGPIGEEYCWMHDPGGWCCPECRNSLL
jgi:hypothetical protein